MEQELIELLLVAKKALSTGQTICAQANTLSQESERHVEIIEKTWPKILFVNNHILVQLSTLERVREFLVLKTEEIRNCIKDRETTLGEVTIELEKIFEMLRQSHIDEDILRVNDERNVGESSEAKNTLFHHIDDQAILELQRHADDEIVEIESLYNSLTTMTKSLSSTISDLASLQETSLSISLDEPASNFANEKLQIQEDEIAKMADILTSLTNHYDQLGEATRLCQSQPEACNQLDITVLQDDHDHIPDILEDLHESLEVVESVSEEIRVRMQVYSSVKEELINVLIQLEQFGAPGGQAEVICDKMVNAEAELKEHEYNLDNFFKQLTSLAEWYRSYASSYNHLILEVERRRKVLEKQEKLQAELLQSFEEAYNAERQERLKWFKQHGQYLPQALCPFMFDPPTKLTVIVEQTAGRLPELSKSSIQKAVTEIQRAEPTKDPVN
ncbi:autophagy protein 17 [Apophysomyces ossiformis]|uniref:Autophagy-related protein 17 n=1 Tax=Apophysomyces ossiformis TaxID=679940 RepID=A0A8H7ESK5_9FUNG|nr:autophagy protein 17 [Apophysomyces ossiformis]